MHAPTTGGRAGLAQGSVPLAVRMRPTSLDEVAGQQHLLGRGSPLVQLATGTRENPGGVSVILWGPPGTGKTTLAQAIARQSGREFVELSAVTAGVKDVREVMEKALTHRDLYGSTTVLFLDEIHRFSKAQQDALLPGVENGWVILIAATTENPSFSVISPLLSRSLLLTLKPLTDHDLGMLVDRAVEDPRGLGGAVVLGDEARSAIIRLASGDARRALTALEAAAASATAAQDEDDATVPVVDADTVAAAVDRALLRYDRQGDEHYDVISAFIKSVRGSDVDAALHYLARMIEAGEDPRFIARRIIISASEDIGMADPQALPDRRRGGPGRPAHRDARGTDPAGRGGRLPGDGAEVERRLHRRQPGDGRRQGAGAWARSRCTCATRTTPGRNASGTARATSTRTTPSTGSPSSSTCRTHSRAPSTTRRRPTATSARSGRGSKTPEDHTRPLASVLLRPPRCC